MKPEFIAWIQLIAAQEYADAREQYELGNYRLAAIGQRCGAQASAMVRRAMGIEHREGIDEPMSDLERVRIGKLWRANP